MHSSDLVLINEIIGESDFHTTAGNTILCIPEVLGGYVAFGHSQLSSHWRKQEMHVEVQIPCVCFQY